MIEAEAKTGVPATAAAPAIPSGPVRPELLAPAGDWECAKAAVENGADAIYFGLERFNARMRAQNFTEADLPKLMDFLHRRGVKGYVTFNTLVFANEMDEARQYLRSIIASGVDAAIVQDVGICRLIRRLSSDFPIHASTQMTITSAAGVDFAKGLGCQLVVLARECSLKEIEKIQAVQTDSALRTPRSAIPLEVFVHGALCVAYSGQCLTSEALGGRSANRGECAQACRMPYELISDGELVPLGDRKYLLSPQDLAGLEMLPELVRSGVASLKIEGRLKSPEYVANITRVYRKALDELTYAPRITPRRSDSKAEPAIVNATDGRDRYNLEMAFSRGLHTGWFRGINNQELVHARFGKKRGVYLGEVTRIAGDNVFLKLEAPLKPGDGVVFDSGHPEENEEGGRVYKVESSNFKAQSESEVVVTFGNGTINFSRVHVGDKVWKTSDPELERRLRRSFAGDQPHFQRPVHVTVHGCCDGPMTVIVRDELGNVAQAASAVPLVQAEKQPLTSERLREQLGRLGGTAFRLGQLDNHLEGAVILPMGELNRLRRQLVGELEALRARPKRWTLVESGTRNAECGNVLSGDKRVDTQTPHSALRAPHLVVLVRNLLQLDAALDCGVETLYCEFEDPKKYREAVTRFREWQSAKEIPAHSALRTPHSALYVAPPRIFKMGEDWILKQVRSSEADGYLIRNYDDLKFFTGCRCIGDFSLNIANPLAADYFKNHFELERVTASYDLNIVQLEALLKTAPPDWFEITIHQHMPMFHMEHCVFCAFLSKGTDYSNCGRPCDKHDVKLRDRVGASHPLKADAGCRNTVFNALAQTGAEHVDRMLALGARHFRIEFVNETAEQVASTVSAYQRLLRGEIAGTRLWRDLKLINQLGVTRGQMVQREP